MRRADAEDDHDHQHSKRKSRRLAGEAFLIGAHNKQGEQEQQGKRLAIKDHVDTGSDERALAVNTGSCHNSKLREVFADRRLEPESRLTIDQHQNP